MTYYTIYLRDTDEIVASGTARQCAEQMNTSINCIYSIVSKTTHGIRNKYDVYRDTDSMDDDSPED